MTQTKIFPPAYVLISVLLMLVLHFLFPLLQIITSPYTYLGIGLIGSGLGVVIWAANLFDKVDTTIKPFNESSYLATEGLYQYTRNPMYVGMVMILIGVATVLGSLATYFIIPIFMGLITQKFIIKEEQMLEEKFGQEYLIYKGKVRRWV